MVVKAVHVNIDMVGVVTFVLVDVPVDCQNHNIVSKAGS